ncbi:hypothetical protein I8J29_31810 [Paenibacillus sp. MWE-103]|uniref:Uncharacterized protein n=1 Tax=Paenibacillus artemisiicola TaxID=1172618 RepID=A0ABS3WL12_9BACL|nr:hypothetical protein [Paenibacillus artemisiicola]MBO7748766.1 hypothetical protein [Paenibacillus artemisiicola]
MNDHSVWYIGLIVISVALLLYTYFKSGNKRSVLLYFGMSGLGYGIEYVIFILFGSYSYEPRLIRDKPYYDELAGAIVSNAMILPAIAVAIAVFRKGWMPILAAIAAMSAVEWFFVRIGIYKHYWWRTWYTSIGLVFYFWAAKLWFARIMRPQRGFIHAVTIMMIQWAFTSPQALEIIFLAGRAYNVHWFGNREHDNIAFSSTYCIAISVFFTGLLLQRGGMRWLIYVLGPAAVLGVDGILAASGILLSRGWWDFAFRFVTMFLMLLAGDAINRHLRKGPPAKAWR